jgi:hypothetical protein
LGDTEDWEISNFTADAHQGPGEVRHRGAVRVALPHRRARGQRDDAAVRGFRSVTAAQPARKERAASGRPSPPVPRRNVLPCGTAPTSPSEAPACPPPAR